MGEPLAQPPSTTVAGRTFIAIVVASMIGCGIALGAAFGIWYLLQPSTDHLADDTLTSLSQYIASDDQLRSSGIKVQSMTVTHGAGNLYEGQATVMDGTVEHLVPLHVVYDGDTLLWTTDPGAFMFALTHQ